MSEPKDSFVERVIATVVKNNATELRISAKDTVARGRSELIPFVEFREYWYKDGPTEAPIPTRKGTMVHRDKMGVVIAAILREMKPGEIDAECVNDIKANMARLGDTDARAVVLKMLGSMSQEDVDYVISNL